MTEKVGILGSTGSVGKQALDVCRHRKIKVTALSAGKDIKLLETQIREFSPEYCAVNDEFLAEELKIKISDISTKVISGKNSSEIIAEVADADTVLNSISGVAGLRPTLAAVKSNKHLALANKESLVVFGETVISEIKKRNLLLLPVDSEHSAIFQCLSGQKIKKLLLTASGGPFYKMKREQLKQITQKEALSHPTWSMGKRITIDSATMMNKGFEVIEAVRLFDVKPEQVEVVIHRESIIHSMVEYTDNAVIAQMGTPDMRLCVQYALTYPERYDSPVEELDFSRLTSLSFSKPDNDNFPLLSLAYSAVKKGGVFPAAMNAADETAVSLFLQDKIGFCDISDIVTRVTLDAPDIISPALDDIEEIDRWARGRVLDLCH